MRVRVYECMRVYEMGKTARGTREASVASPEACARQFSLELQVRICTRQFLEAAVLHPERFELYQVFRDAPAILFALDHVRNEPLGANLGVSIRSTAGDSPELCGSSNFLHNSA